MSPHIIYSLESETYKNEITKYKIWDFLGAQVYWVHDDEKLYVEP